MKDEQNDSERNERHEPESGTKSGGAFDAEAIAAYVVGDMTDSDLAAFERRLEWDAALRREVEATRRALEAAREWFGAEPPGVERLDRLEIPAVVGLGATMGQQDSVEKEPVKPGMGEPGRQEIQGAQVIPVWGWGSRLRLVLAAAAIFVLGVAVGRLAMVPPADSGREAVREVARPIAEEMPTAPTTSVARETGTQTEIEVAAPPVREQTPHPPTPTPSIRRSYEENGRLVVETTSSNTGTRAIWVVDAGLRINVSSDSGNDEVVKEIQ